MTALDLADAAGSPVRRRLRRPATVPGRRTLRRIGPHAALDHVQQRRHRGARQFGPRLQLCRLPDHVAHGPPGHLAADVARHAVQVAAGHARHAGDLDLAVGPEPGRGGTDPLLPRRRRHHGGAGERRRIAAGPGRRLEHAAARRQRAERGRDQEFYHEPGGRCAPGGRMAERPRTESRPGRPARRPARRIPSRLVGRASRCWPRPATSWWSAAASASRSRWKRP